MKIHRLDDGDVGILLQLLGASSKRAGGRPRRRELKERVRRHGRKQTWFGKKIQPTRARARFQDLLAQNHSGKTKEEGEG